MHAAWKYAQFPAPRKQGRRLNSFLFMLAKCRTIFDLWICSLTINYSLVNERLIIAIFKASKMHRKQKMWCFSNVFCFNWTRIKVENFWEASHFLFLSLFLKQIFRPAFAVHLVALKIPAFILVLPSGKQTANFDVIFLNVIHSISNKTRYLR